MDREEERLRAALDRAAPQVDEDGVMESVVRKGRSLRRRRRLGRGAGNLAAVVVLALLGFGVDSAGRKPADRAQASPFRRLSRARNQFADHAGGQLIDHGDQPTPRVPWPPQPRASPQQ